MKVELVMLGGSWGGAAAAGRVLTGLGPDFGAPVVAVFHRQVGSDEDALSRSLARHSPLPVCDADDKDDLVAGRVLVAPAGYHLLVEPGSVALSTEAAVHYSRPSIDVAFDTAARAYGRRVAGVVLTGANADGAFGLARIKQAGGRAIVQDPETAVRREMPDAAIAATHVDAVAAPEEIGPLLQEMCA
jgi:two-component system chemotaxis response regulator CheB